MDTLNNEDLNVVIDQKDAYEDRLVVLDGLRKCQINLNGYENEWYGDLSINNCKFNPYENNAYPTCPKIRGNFYYCDPEDDYRSGYVVMKVGTIDCDMYVKYLNKTQLWFEHIPDDFFNKWTYDCYCERAKQTATIQLNDDSQGKIGKQAFNKNGIFSYAGFSHQYKILDEGFNNYDIYLMTFSEEDEEYNNNNIIEFSRFSKLIDFDRNHLEPIFDEFKWYYKYKQDENDDPYFKWKELKEFKCFCYNENEGDGDKNHFVLKCDKFKLKIDYEKNFNVSSTGNTYNDWQNTYAAEEEMYCDNSIVNNPFSRHYVPIKIDRIWNYVPIESFYDIDQSYFTAYKYCATAYSQAIPKAFPNKICFNSTEEYPYKQRRINRLFYKEHVTDGYQYVVIDNNFKTIISSDGKINKYMYKTAQYQYCRYSCINKGDYYEIEIVFDYEFFFPDDHDNSVHNVEPIINYKVSSLTPNYNVNATYEEVYNIIENGNKYNNELIQMIL